MRYHSGWYAEMAFLTPAQPVGVGEPLPPQPTLRIKYGSRYFNILSVADIQERHRWLEIRSKEKVV
jgi:hypothetical protein